MSTNPLASPLARALAGSVLALATAAAGPALADPYRDGVVLGYGTPGYGTPGYGGYGFADGLVGGSYIGAPLTKVPRPSELVPAPWTYGTYGVPTFSGKRQAPAGEPTLYVIDAPAARSRAPAKSRVLSRGRDGQWSRFEPAPASAGGARVITVSVPRR
ncbi:hypothetical protein [Methylobacterium oxalidis]|uniref:Uncharacterized protein n=1 Tax=Methylobacterium oxalidis TaxID=944322 RepID=A0A512J0P8_9HYPH|nr:hypothetical protein [Methylobacterium oxalidis]GEP03534.1 hypothetical protein MOX02_15720 [Methylobacterium oxalidis]GJE34486.1 hypothetical protein LDDCCGHA_4697 [Methylobacterium oxalidis]GLS66546.1 hypothetical protein GCM10007888_49290 [Methylobacterium oxalidis]